MFSRPIDVSRHGLIYAGAQKNMGPAGVTLVIIRDDLLAPLAEVDADDAQLRRSRGERIDATTRRRRLPSTRWASVVKWLIGAGRAECRSRRSTSARPQKLYAEIDRTGFYRGTAAKDCRSLMNVTFALRPRISRSAFVKESTAAGLDGLKGHRSVGGMRASIYNAFPEAGIDALVQFMQEFERTRG